MSFRHLPSRLATLLLVIGVLLAPALVSAQVGGNGAISGSVADSTGALVPGAQVTALNTATGISTTRPSSSSGLYNISPLTPGTYTLTVTAGGFQTFKQENIAVDALANIGINITLQVGSQNDIVTVSAAPPALDTTSATLGGTINNQLYTALPIMIAGSQQRDITQFSNLLPGAQVPPGGRSSIIGGTAQRLGELYVDGLPITTQSQQGDNRPVFNLVPLEAIDQVKVVTSGFNAEYQGAGLENYNLKAGGNQYHGSIFAYFRNTAFDAWSFSSKPGGGNKVSITDPNTGLPTTVPGPKPAEHQTELGFSVGGPVKIPFLYNGHDKLFFYAAYDKFRSRIGVNPTATSIPTTLMQGGDFRELLSTANGGLGNTSNINYPIYDPTSLANCTAHSTNGPCRYQYGYGPGATNGAAGNPVLQGTPNRILPSQLSPISQYQQKFLPAPSVTTVGVIQNNYFGGSPSGYDNWIYSGRIDWNISQRQTLSMAVTGGNRHAVPYTSQSTPNYLPVPYINTTLSTVGGHWADLQHTYTITSNLVNQFKYGFMNFGGPPVQSITGSVPNSPYALSASGITGLPAGQASQNAANTTFSGGTPPASWVGNTPTTTNVSNTFTALDNLQWVKGRHSMNFGGQYQWLQNNLSVNDGPSAPTSLTWSTQETAQLNNTNATAATNTGYSYASFMVGAVNASGATLQPFGVVGGRFKPWAIYFQDDYKVTPKLTLNLGLRWDWIPTYTETLDRWSFLNPGITNPVTGNLGALQFAGGYGGTGVSCGCSTPINNYYKNFGPRLGFAYAPDDKTVFRGGWGVLYSHAGGTGGIGGAGNGTGQTGFNSVTSFTSSIAGASAAPAFYLNNSAGYQALGNMPNGKPYANANLGGPSFTLPAIAPPGAISQTQGVGYYNCNGETFAPCNGNVGSFAGTGSGMNFADKYIAGRAPELLFYNFGIQRQITQAITVSADYVGSQSHFLTGAGNIRGLYSGQLDPQYLTLGNNTNCHSQTGAAVSCLTAPATAANIAIAGVTPSNGYARYSTAAQELTGVTATTGSSATVAHLLTWMPQFSGTTDTWPDIANANYNAFQLSITHRSSHGLTLNINYTYSKNIDDAGTMRSGYAIPASANATGKAWAANRMDRSLSANSQPQNLSIFGVYNLPFGKNGIGGDKFWVRAILGGWDISGISQYYAGLPLAIVGTCNANQNVGQGTCMPDLNPNFQGSPRINGGWAKGVTAATLGTTSYIQGYINSTTSGVGVGGASCATSTGPFCNSGNYMIGDSPRIAPYGLRGPGVYRLTGAVMRTFDITERFKFIFRADCQNVTNSVTFGNNAQNNATIVNVNTSTFGTLTFASADSRAFQFSGRITF
jgi:Carboxypeptidase regulatory-like domain/TonB dependent receptor